MPIEEEVQRVFLPVKWGKRTYLVPADKLQAFCDAIIRGDEPRNKAPGDFYVTGLENQVDGLPELPKSWADFVRDNIVLGTIVHVSKDARAKLDVGSADGLQDWSIFAVQGRGGEFPRALKVITLSTESCVVEEVYSGNSEKPLEIGWKVVAMRPTEEATNP